jgi:aryl-alcohol dehydrogenase-like predicted oxidoreductase
MTFGRENEATEEESFQMMDHFGVAGGNFIDTANVYSTGISEEIVGRWLQRQRRDDWVIATKVRFPMGAGPNDLGLSRKHILSSVEASLRRLQTDYIDLYQVHCWDSKTPLEETLSTLNDLVRRGVVRYLGASNFGGWQLQRAIDISREAGWEGFVCLQPQYNLEAQGRPSMRSIYSCRFAAYLYPCAASSSIWTWIVSMLPLRSGTGPNLPVSPSQWVVHAISAAF